MIMLKFFEMHMGYVYLPLSRCSQNFGLCIKWVVSVINCRVKIGTRVSM